MSKPNLIDRLLEENGAQAFAGWKRMDAPRRLYWKNKWRGAIEARVDLESINEKEPASQEN